MEEFGITAVEAQAAGRPVIAAAAGGARETVIDGETGRLARLDDVDAFVRAIESLDSLDFEPQRAVRNAQRFSVAAFQRRLSAHLAEVCELARESRAGRPNACSQLSRRERQLPGAFAA
jgi:glycosyltransferase involved in cell wall biosynthesis